MGMSQDAYVAWGFDLGGPEDGWKCNGDKFDELDGKMAELCGFTEKYPGISSRAESDAWGERLRAAVPLGYSFYGNIDYAGHILCLNRTTYAYWGVADFDLKATEPPTEYELECFSKVLDYLEYEGGRTPKLLIWASYG